jgi:hypothetical protein
LFSHRHNKENDDEHARYFPLRHFSSSVSENKTLRQQAVERAQQGAARARERAAQARVRGTKLAKQGAKTGYAMLKQYGPVFVGFYFTLYVTTLGSLFAGVDSGLIDPVTIFAHVKGDGVAESKSTAEFVMDYLSHYTWTRPAVPFLEQNPHFANLAVAWVLTKFTEPPRLLVSMAVVPRLADYLGFVPHPVEETEESPDHEEKKP